MRSDTRELVDATAMNPQRTLGDIKPFTANEVMRCEN